MIYKVHNKDKNFTMIDNNIFHNKNLSLQAKGLLCIMLSLSDSWDFNKKGLISLSKHICENTFNKILEELKTEGYLGITQNGLDWQWDVYETPDLKICVTDTPKYDISQYDISQNGGCNKIPNNKILNNKILNNKILNNNTVCATSKNEVAPTPTKYIFPCKPSKNNKNIEWVLSQEDLDWYLETYPNLDINLELRKAWRWLKENNLKTYSGMGKFISSWLARANNQTPSKRSQELKDKARETYIQVNKPKSQQIAESFDQVEEYAKAFIGEIDDTGQQ